MNSSSNTNNIFLEEIASYYGDKLAQFGETARGVDWNGLESQELRFGQLAKILPNFGDFSICDLGCGYGALLEYLQNKHPLCTYLGVDISPEMVQAAQNRYANVSNARFIRSAEPDQISDYGVASGIFNVRLGRTEVDWYEYLVNTLDALNRTSKLGFSFNCLTSYSDRDKKRDYLFYADPCRLFDLCKIRYSNQVALLHDYGLYEFTILVRKAV